MTKKNDFIDYEARAYVSSVDKMPAGEHYAIITNTSTDDGYGGRRPAIEYTAFHNRDEWEWEIKSLTKRGEPFRAFVAKPATVTTVVKVDP